MSDSESEDNMYDNQDSGSGSEDEAPEPEKKKRKQIQRRRVIKDPNAPKKPKSAYLFFCDQERPKLQARGDLSFGEVGKELGKMWKDLSDRRKFDAMAVEDKSRYDEEMEDYDAPPVRYKDSKNGKKYKDPAHPKKGKSAYLFFCEIERPKLGETDMSFGEVGKELGKRWKDVPEAEKAIFKAQAAEDKARYEDEMEDYVPPPDPSTKKKKRDPNAPKKNKSAYLFFCDAERPKLQARKDLSFGEVGKELGRMWKLKTSRGQFEAMAAADKIRYDTEMMSYRN